MTRLKRKSLENTSSTSLKTCKSNCNKNLLSKSKDKPKTLDKSNVMEKLTIKEEVCEISSDDDNDNEIYKNKIEILEELNKDNSMSEPFEDTAVTDEEIDIEIDNDLDVEEESEETSPEISFKLIIKQERECSAAKWEAISQTTFKNFKKELNLLIQTQLDKWIGYDDYIVSYKLEKETGSGTQLTDE